MKSESNSTGGCGIALVGALLALLFIGVCYEVVNVLATVRGFTVFDPEELFVVGGRSLDSRIPYLPWTFVIYEGGFLLTLLLPAFTYPKTESGARRIAP